MRKLWLCLILIFSIVNCLPFQLNQNKTLINVDEGSKESRIQLLIEAVLVALEEKETEAKNGTKIKSIEEPVCEEVTWYNVLYYGLFGEKRFCTDI